MRHSQDFEQQLDDSVVLRRAGDEWLFEGPGTLIPRAEVQRVRAVKATVLMPNQALRLRAKTEFVDRVGNER